ncbi:MULTISPECIES: hypothetical protein [Streptomyces]|uniref:Uncharacterized protein n=1 Tax=Streptomyces stelliscabiei TaxID=146820 RepID=A0A8I0P1A6_9ACTN|nr:MULTISPECIES: hypothetical protein [Streptomyces]MBE1594195.1 hypothetical protein [Streptomyces stelliscabiei]MDX2520252.1 hypothetical protein [Streptomyces stelliscabiei]MDX2836635.1 hypothetical protein [Streptomyces scabiei]MDX3279447.1 hypothetical protein [Streptomyces scabiei]MDX3681470.1 hypothetical protein [Streptomyces scabiei]
MTGRRRLRRVALSLTLWWKMIAVVLWLVGTVLDRPAMLRQCAASSSFLVVVGEVGDWFR